jgi:hypothetical protein
MDNAAPLPLRQKFNWFDKAPIFRDFGGMCKTSVELPALPGGSAAKTRFALV